MKKIYLLPNFMTLCNLMCGYWAVTFAIKGSYAQAAVMIYFSLIFDVLDGRIARLTNTTSRFGLEFDSLADAISFGFAPAAIVYSLFAHNNDVEKLAWWSCFLFVVCSVLRLARYNVQSNNEEKDDFTGLPTPCAAGFIASYVLFKVKYDAVISAWVILPLMLMLAFLMVSTLRYNSFSKIDLKKRNSFSVLVIVVVCLGLLVRFPQQILLVVFLGYIISGIWPFFVKKQQRALAPIDDVD